MKNYQTDEFIFVPFGGVGEIGMNMYGYAYGTPGNRKWIIVDCGVTFATYHQPGIDLIMPDISFLEEEADNILALILTHSHEDHFGAVLDIWPSFNKPVYATSFTNSMIKSKYISNNMFAMVDVKPLIVGKEFNLGPFTIEAINMAHSIPQSNALLISTPIAQALHSGDWKLDANPIGSEPTNEKRLREIGKHKLPLALICDSTNAEKEGKSASEEEVAKNIEKIIASAKKRVVFTSFASNVGRIISIARAAKKANRKVILSGTSLQKIAIIAQENGLLDGIEPFLDQDAYLHLERDKVVLIVTGSQGERRAALSKIANGTHSTIELDRGDLMVFSSWAIPGNEKEVINIQNRLIDKGVNIITNSDKLVHVSGHPRRDELRELYKWVRPDILIPVHGEPMHLEAHAQLGKDEGIEQIFSIRNGDMVRIAPNCEQFNDEFPVGELYLDGNILCKPEESGVRDRRKLSFNGIISISICINKRGELILEPQIKILGIPLLEDEEEGAEEIVNKCIKNVIYSMPQKRRLDSDKLVRSIKKAIRNEIRDYWGKKPNINIFVHNF